jgi:hypothetical protein
MEVEQEDEFKDARIERRLIVSSTQICTRFVHTDKISTQMQPWRFSVHSNNQPGFVL